MLQAAASSLITTHICSSISELMLISVASKAASAAHHLLVKVKAAAVIGLLDAQQQIIDLAFADQQKQAVACRHHQELPAIAADAEHTPVDEAVCKFSAPAASLNPVTMSILRRADGLTQVLLVGTRAGSEASLAEVLGIVSRACKGTPVFLQLKPPREQHCSKDADAVDGPHDEAALWPSIIWPAQVLADACIRQAISLLQTACGRSMADHMAVVAFEAAAAGLHIVYGLRAGNAAETVVAACCCLQDLKSMLSTLPKELPTAPDSMLLSCSRPEPVLTRAASAAFVQWVKSAHPAAAAACIGATDERLAEQLLQLRSNTVAVVGHAHMAGIEQAWRRAHGNSSVQCA